MAEAATGDHRHVSATGGYGWREHERDVVAHTAGGVLVQDGAIEFRPCQNRAGIAHRQRQGHRLVPRHAVEKDGHCEGPDLPFGDRIVGYALDEGGNVPRVQPPVVAFGGDKFLRQEGHGLVRTMAGSPHLYHATCAA